MLRSVVLQEKFMRQKSKSGRQIYYSGYRNIDLYGGIGLSLCQKQEKEIRAVLFDKDGTLIDFYAIWTPIAFELVERVAAQGPAQDKDQNKRILLKAIGVEPDGTMAQNSIYASGSVEEVSDVLYKTASALQIPMRDIKTLTAEVQAEINGYLASNSDRIRPIDGVEHTLKALREMGIVLGVSTSDSRESTMACLLQAGLRDYFQYIGCADDVKKPKPSGDILLDFCARFGLSAEEVAIAGDTEVDIEFARQNGAGLSIGVLSGACGQSVFERGADFVLDSAAEIVKDGIPVWAEY